MKDDERVIGFNQEICCVTDTGPRDNTHMQTDKNPSKHTYSQTLTHTHTHAHTRTQYDPSWQSMTQILYEPLPLGSCNSVFSQSVFLARDWDLIHTLFFLLSVSILHEQRHKHTRSSTNNNHFFYSSPRRNLC